MSDSEDIECPRCHRISFAFDRTSLGKAPVTCAECHWTIRPSPVARPYGHDVLIAVNLGTFSDTTVERHFKGTEARARAQAKRVAGYRKLLALVPLDEGTWIRTYGEGRL